VDIEVDEGFEGRYLADSGCGVGGRKALLVVTEEVGKRRRDGAGRKR